MDNDEKYFINLLAAFIKGTVPPLPQNINWQNIFNLSRIHFLSGAVYVSLKKVNELTEIEPKIYQKFKKDFYSTIVRFEAQEKLYSEIKSILNENRIPHVFFKGANIREYYPVKQMRTLGDIDLLIHEEDRRCVNILLLECGYKNESPIGNVWNYNKNNFELEVHDKILYENINDKADYISYFNDAWSNAYAIEESYTYQFKAEYHLIYLINHIAKHIYKRGCGVRMILDIAVIINKFGASLNYSYILEELKKMKLNLFALNIFNLCFKWFGIDIPDKTLIINNIDIDTISKFILEGGTFGFNKSNQNSYLIRKEYEKTDNHKIALFKAFWNKIFLEYDEIKNSYAILKKCPFLLPFCWVLRGVECVFTKPQKTANILKDLATGSGEAENSYDVLKKMGLL